MSKIVIIDYGWEILEMSRRVFEKIGFEAKLTRK